MFDSNVRYNFSIFNAFHTCIFSEKDIILEETQRDEEAKRTIFFYFRLM